MTDTATTTETSTVPVVSRKAPVVLTGITVVLAVVLLLSPREGDTTFRVATGADFFQLPDLVVPAVLTCWILLAVLTACSALSWQRTVSRQPTPLWLVVLFAVAAMLVFLTWAAAGSSLPMVGLLAGAIALAVPLVFGAMAGVIGERAGVVNIAIDGQLLAGAFAAAVTGSLTGSMTAAMVAAALTGLLMGLVLGLFAISYYVEQVIVGVVLNVLIIGLTSFLYGQVLVPNSDTLNSPPSLPRLPIPLLSEIPLVGPVLFRQTIIVYLMYVVVALCTWGLYRTRWGLRVRAVGEHPQAADTVGIKVARTRYRAVMLAGAIAGLGGAYFTLVSVSQFNREMTGGAGYIALAAVIFGKWDPVRAMLAALLFGFASNLQGVLSVIGSPVPSQFMLMLPYIVTIFAVAGLVGRSQAPAADGVPYRKG